MARNVVRMDIDMSKAQKKLKALERDLEKQGEQTTQHVGLLGKNYARSKAPYWSGATFRSIQFRKRAGGTEAVIFSDVGLQSTANDGHKRSGSSNKYRTRGRFDLVKWMHTSPYADSHITSGNPKFMYETYDYLTKKFPNTMKEQVTKIVTKINNR